MTHSEAPFFQEVARGPRPGAAYWVTTSDDTRVRFSVWRPDDETQAKGTVLLFPGRTEFVEKYAETGNAFADRGFAMIAVDWRGQGLADRLLADGRIGHVKKFPDYQMDVAAVMNAVRALGLPEPFHLIGHSMGGAIGLRAVYEGLNIETCVFTGPMWGISLSPPLRALGLVLPSLAKLVGASGHKAPTTRYENYVTVEPFEGNMLTSDAEMFDMMHAQLTAHPELALGGPSLNWVREALDESNALHARPSPKQPGICFVGAGEIIIDVNRCHDRMSRWTNGEIDVVKDGRHEVLVEKPNIRSYILDRATALFTGDYVPGSSKNAAMTGT